VIGRKRLIVSRKKATFPAELSALAAMRELIRRFAVQDSVDAAIGDDLVLAVSEACTNAILHSGSGTVHITWRARGDCVRISVRDEGVFRRAVSTSEATGGRGILIMMAMMDEVAIREGTIKHPGTTVSLVHCRGR
jgi:anti-sigma regulatory factor (Ser/Thr protein kinase)